MSRFVRAAVAVLQVLVMLGVSGCQLGDPNATTVTRWVLFIGNSLTYTNDIPGIVEAFADSVGGERIQAVSVVQGDYALIDHWNEAAAHDAIAAGGWNMVILQQGPSAVQVNRDSLRLLTSMFAEEIQDVDGRIGLYSVWPQESNVADFPRAIESYTLAAEDVDGILLPVARAWLEAWERDPNIELYDPDGLHPSELGSYLAALVIYSKVMDRSPRGLPRSIRTSHGVVISLSPAEALVLQSAAAEATGR